MTTAATTQQARAADAAKATTRPGPRWPRRNPWGHPWFLEGFTWLYLVWSLVPIVLAILFSFNSGKSQAVWQGFSLRWYLTDPVLSVAHSNVLQLAVLQTLKLSAYTTLIAVPLGVLFALGIHRWRTRTAASFSFVMLLSFVIPELIFGVAMFFVFTSLFHGIGLGTLAQTLALVTWNVSWPAIIVQARLATIGNSYSEAAADLGCNPFQTMYRVWLRLLSPAILASAILVFSTVIDDFVIVDLLSNTAASTPMSVYIYSTQRGGNGGPALNALGTIMLVMSFVIAIGGYLAYRAMTRGERGTGSDTLVTIADS
ncbi:MAG TPA: ABC transporter permease [Streptosporangiaceae bacterium]|nr:ABC transporter permease [Streptosporangiaceae bacterium]